MVSVFVNHEYITLVIICTEYLICNHKHNSLDEYVYLNVFIYDLLLYNFILYSNALKYICKTAHF